MTSSAEWPEMEGWIPIALQLVHESPHPCVCFIWHLFLCHCYLITLFRHPIFNGLWPFVWSKLSKYVDFYWLNLELCKLSHSMIHREHFEAVDMRKKGAKHCLIKWWWCHSTLFILVHLVKNFYASVAAAKEQSHLLVVWLWWCISVYICMKWTYY